MRRFRPPSSTTPDDREEVARAEERARESARSRETAARAKKEAEKEAAARAKKAAAARAKKEAAARAKKEAEKKEAEKKAAARAKKEAEKKAAARAKKAAAARAKKEAAARAKKEAEKKEAEKKAAARAKKEAEKKAAARAKKAAAARAKKEAAAHAKKEAEKKEAEKKAAARAKKEAEKKAAARAKKEAEKKAAARAKKEAEKKAAARAKKEAAARAKKEAEKKLEEKAHKRVVARPRRTQRNSSLTSITNSRRSRPASFDYDCSEISRRRRPASSEVQARRSIADAIVSGPIDDEVIARQINAAATKKTEMRQNTTIEVYRDFDYGELTEDQSGFICGLAKTMQFATQSKLRTGYIVDKLRASDVIVFAKTEQHSLPRSMRTYYYGKKKKQGPRMTAGIPFVTAFALYHSCVEIHETNPVQFTTNLGSADKKSQGGDTTSIGKGPGVSKETMAKKSNWVFNSHDPIMTLSILGSGVSGLAFKILEHTFDSLSEFQHIALEALPIEHTLTFYLRMGGLYVKAKAQALEELHVDTFLAPMVISRQNFNKVLRDREAGNNHTAKWKKVTDLYVTTFSMLSDEDPKQNPAWKTEFMTAAKSGADAMFYSD
jgi:hypothetical protein